MEQAAASVVRSYTPVGTRTEPDFKKNIFDFL